MSMVPKSIDNMYRAHQSRVWTMAIIDHCQVATGSEDGTIRIWNYQKGTCVHILSGHQLAVFSILVLDDGTLVSASKDGWDLHTGRCTTVVTETASILTIITFGNFLASGSHPTINIYKISDLRSIKYPTSSLATLNGHDNSVYCLAKNDKYLASGSKDFTVILWDRSSFAFVNRFFGHKSTVCDVALKDNILISSSLDSTVRVWDTKSTNCLKVLNQHNGCIHSILHHDKFLLSAGRDARILGWDLDQFNLLFSITEQSAVIDVMLIDNGCLFGGSVDGNVLVWNILSTIRSVYQIENLLKYSKSSTHSDVNIFTYQ